MLRAPVRNVVSMQEQMCTSSRAIELRNIRKYWKSRHSEQKIQEVWEDINCVNSNVSWEYLKTRENGVEGVI